MTYEQAIEYIHSVSNYFCKPGLDRIKTLCSKLNNPQNNLNFVHVAGTNGKGSFCAILTSILHEAGYNVGTYTSPYVLQFNERIAVNGETISNNDLTNICEYVKSFCDEISDDSPTEFELITAIAFEYFKRKNCDIVILECGMGGRFDATNIINSPVLSVITGVDFDHQNFLGNTIEEIALEKAGIIKKNIPCLWCGTNESAEKIINRTAIQLNTSVIKPDLSKLSIISTDLAETIFNYKDYKNLKLHMLGDYQPLNACNAICAAEFLNNNSFPIEYFAIQRGVEKAKWKARFEILNNDPIIIFDGAHNPQGISAAVSSIKKYFKDKKVNIITGVMADKNYKFIAKQISSVANSVYCITPDNARALSANDYSLIFNELKVDAKPFENIVSAVKACITASKVNNTPIVCLGSLYMYADICKILGI